ncbi:hypothetical protein [Micromonospora yangpuensis]|uniref:Uncharacterized protein n=1 Tax=Micromonospora yangpuensis TaxID=683228 RepID=A0A1C6V3J7_9ACTN|nr:hypothetical protein [Micromonospora yangpuensis]GGM14693.1 hypothetical protein GCM10012279_36030 [Micromonospora yangpuensis]SCL60694.1 hypothetical protein GA0070617_4449 [Micromonospora yangpuensis]
MTTTTPTPPARSRVRRFLADLAGTPFGLAVLACLALAGWALWSGGILDTPMARQVRNSSVYAAPGVELDRTAAERIIGNRRLVVLMTAPGTDLAAACKEVRLATKSTLVLAMSPDGDDWDTYGCARFSSGDETKDFGRAMVAETTIGRGTDGFVDRPLEALKVIVVNYDRLVKAGIVPDGARTISPSLPRFLLAGAAVLGVVAGATTLYLGGRRAGRLAAVRRARRDERTDDRSALSAATAGLAQQLIDLDQTYARIGRTPRSGRDHQFLDRYRTLTTEYVALLDDLAPTAGDAATVVRLRERVDGLSRRAAELADRFTGPATARRPTAD